MKVSRNIQLFLRLQFCSSLLIVVNGSIGLLERMKAGEFDLEMVDYNSPDPPDIDQMKKDELYTL